MVGKIGAIKLDAQSTQLPEVGLCQAPIIRELPDEAADVGLVGQGKDPMKGVGISRREKPVESGAAENRRRADPALLLLPAVGSCSGNLRKIEHHLAAAVAFVRSGHPEYTD